MPLPALPADTVARYKLRYDAAGTGHAIIVHMGTTQTQADAVTNGTALANVLKTLMATNAVFNSIEFAELGSPIFNAVASLNIAGTTTNTLTPTGRPWYYCFVGRSASGRKTRLFLFGIGPQSDGSWRFTGSEYTLVANAVTALNSGTGGVHCIDGTMPTWKNYVNVGAHDHWIKAIRKSG